MPMTDNPSLVAHSGFDVFGCSNSHFKTVENMRAWTNVGLFKSLHDPYSNKWHIWWFLSCFGFSSAECRSGPPLYVYSKQNSALSLPQLMVALFFQRTNDWGTVWKIAFPVKLDHINQTYRFLSGLRHLYYFGSSQNGYRSSSTVQLVLTIYSSVELSYVFPSSA